MSSSHLGRSYVNRFIGSFGECCTLVPDMSSLCSTLKGAMEKTWKRWGNEGMEEGDLVDHGEIWKLKKTER